MNNSNSPVQTLPIHRIAPSVSFKTEDFSLLRRYEAAPLYIPQHYQYPNRLPSADFACRIKPKFFPFRDYMVHKDGTVEFC
jgi:hypothetical protein